MRFIRFAAKHGTVRTTAVGAIAYVPAMNWLEADPAVQVKFAKQGFWAFALTSLSAFRVAYTSNRHTTTIVHGVVGIATGAMAIFAGLEWMDA